MGIVKISEQVYSVGVLNPALRTFDIIMESKFGTSYNAYLVTDNNKNVLIDTVHPDYFDEYIYNVGCLAEISEIDYIVMNHTELDHSGSLEKLIDINPDITVVCTAAAQKYLKQILNRDFKCKTVKHNELLKVGSIELQFVVAPLLHWPDSMMTYLISDGVLFSCDFLGCHFCEPMMLEESIHYKKEYLGEFKIYYDAIFGPFKKYVTAGLDKISDLDLRYVCPSHGPVLSDGIKERLDDYRIWSTPSLKSEKEKATVIYASAYGCTGKLAEAVFDEIKRQDKFDVEIFDLTSSSKEDVIKRVNDSLYLFVGSCTINKDAPKVVWDVLSSIDAINSRGRLAGVFGSYGWSGEAVNMISGRLSDLGYKVLNDGIKVNLMPTEEDISNIKKYALEVMSSK